jgi:hypothetical protein
MIRSVSGELEELIMGPNDRNYSASTSSDKARDPATLDFIERISWFERERPVAADNDNAVGAASDSACFQSWALPDYLRK